MSLFGTGRREGCLAVLLLLVLCVALHAPGLFLGRARTTPTSGEPAANATILLPAMHLAGRALADGELPLWNDHARFGEPFTASGAELLYPPFWLLLLDGGARYLEWLLCLHAFIGCLTMYRFLRCLPLTRYTAFVAGGSYGLGWFLTVQLDRLPEAAAAAWLPFALELTWRLVLSGRRAGLGPVLGVALALPFLCGGTAVAWSGVALCGLFFAASLPAIHVTDRRAAVTAVALGATVAALLTAPCWLDALQNGPHLRQAADSAPGRLQPAGLLGLLSPLVHAAGAPAAARDLNPAADPLELTLYPGALVLFLLLLGLLRPKRTWQSLFWTMTAAVGLLATTWSSWAPELGLGAWSGALGARPGAGLVLLHLAVTVMAATVLDSFFDTPLRRRFAVPVTAGAWLAYALGLLVLASLAAGSGQALVARATGWPAVDAADLAAHLRRALLPFAAPLVACSLLFVAWRRLGILRFKVALASVAFAELLLLGWLAVPRNEPEAGLVAAAPVAGGASTAAAANLVPAGERAVVAGTGALPSAAALHAAGVHAVSGPGESVLERTARFLDLVDPSMVKVGARAEVEPLQSPELLRHPLLDVAAVATGIAARAPAVEGFAPLVAAPGGAAPVAGDALWVARRSTEPTRWRVLHRSLPVRSADEAALAVARHAAKLGELIVVEGADPAFAGRRPGAPAEVQAARVTRNELALRVQMGQGRGWLLIADAWAPGWRASVDGVPATVLAADLAFRALPLPEGTHDVRLAYEPWLVRFGLPAMVLGALLALVVFVVQFVLAHRRRRPET